MKLLALFSFILASVGSLQAQRLSFGSFVSDAINLTIVDNQAGLNFNNKQRVIIVGDPTTVNVSLTDLQTVVVEVDAPIEFDINCELTFDRGLSLGGADTGIFVPLLVRIAYNNTGELSDVQRRMNAVEVPIGFSNITLPVRRRVSGAPGPPPTPEHGGYVRPRGKAYFYLYGTLGPIPNGIPSGTYLGDINLNLSYTDNTL